MKNILIVLLISLQSLSCQTTKKCIESISIERFYEGPLPDLIIIGVKLSEEDQAKIIDDSHSRIDFYINEKEFFTTRFIVFDKENGLFFFRIRTPYFNYKRNFKEADFYKLINSSNDLRVEFVYEDTGETFTFRKCR